MLRGLPNTTEWTELDPMTTYNNKIEQENKHWTGHVGPGKDVDILLAIKEEEGIMDR